MAKTDLFTFGDEDLENTNEGIQAAGSTATAVRGFDESGPEAPQTAPAFCSRPDDVGARQGAQRSRDGSGRSPSAKRELPALLFKVACAAVALALLVSIGSRLFDGGGSGKPTSVAIKNSALPRAIASPGLQGTNGSQSPVGTGPRAAAGDKQVERKRSVTRRRAPRRRTPRRRQKREARSLSVRGRGSKPAVPAEVEPVSAPADPPVGTEEAVEPIADEESSEPVSNEPAPAPSPSGGEAAQSQFGVESGAGG